MQRLENRLTRLEEKLSAMTKTRPSSVIKPDYRGWEQAIADDAHERDIAACRSIAEIQKLLGRADREGKRIKAGEAAPRSPTEPDYRGFSVLVHLDHLHAMAVRVLELRGFNASEVAQDARRAVEDAWNQSTGGRSGPAIANWAQAYEEPAPSS